MVINNAAEGENNIKYASSYPMNWTVKTQDFKGHGHDTDEWRDYDEDNVPFEWLEVLSRLAFFPTRPYHPVSPSSLHGQRYLRSRWLNALPSDP